MCAASQLAAVGLGLFLIPAAFASLAPPGHDQGPLYKVVIPSVIGLGTSAVGAIQLLRKKRNGIWLTAIGLTIWFYISNYFWVGLAGAPLGGLFLLGTLAMMVELGIGWLIRGNYRPKPS